MIPTAIVDRLAQAVAQWTVWQIVKENPQAIGQPNVSILEIPTKEIAEVLLREIEDQKDHYQAKVLAKIADFSKILERVEDSKKLLVVEELLKFTTFVEQV